MRVEESRRGVRMGRGSGDRSKGWVRLRRGGRRILVVVLKLIRLEGVGVGGSREVGCRRE
jgi:hypothetical protein